MLKNKIKKMQKEVDGLFPDRDRFTARKAHQKRKYTLDDWTIEDIRKVVFPEGRDLFDPDDEELEKKWNETNWLNREFLELLSVDELKALKNWMEKRNQERRQLKG